MTTIIDGNSGVVFPNNTTQASAGQVLQVVNATYSTEVSSSSASWSDTGLTATITPKFSTSKILVIVEQVGLQKAVGDAGLYLQLVRNGSTLINLCTNDLYNGSTNVARTGGVGCSYLDSPSTTSATTYKTQMWSWLSRSSVYVQQGGATSTITLMEIAA